MSVQVCPRSVHSLPEVCPMIKRSTFSQQFMKGQTIYSYNLRISEKKCTIRQAHHMYVSARIDGISSHFPDLWAGVALKGYSLHSATPLQRPVTIVEELKQAHESEPEPQRQERADFAQKISHTGGRLISDHGRRQAVVVEQKQPHVGRVANSRKSICCSESRIKVVTPKLP